ncbi:MAG: hypothetical protein QG635_882 [Bacteroidota bacterium]|nr:hypothetical protein [Bacteroidota bacterium]
MNETTPKRKIKLNLLTFLGIIAGMIWLFVFMYYMNQVPDINKVTKIEIQSVIDRDTAKAPPLDIIKGKPMPGVNVMDVGYSNQKLLAIGDSLFKTTCASCHGEKGLGDGAAGATLTPKPRNFHSPDGWKNGQNISALYKTLEEGIPGSGMTAYEFLPVEDRFALIHYIRNMAAGYPAITEAELKQIDDIYDLASPRLSASQIPLKLAEAKMSGETKDFSVEIDKLINKLDDNNTVALKLLNNVAADKRRMLTTLLRNKAWERDFNFFIQLISDNPVISGFKPSAMKLTKEQISELHSFLKSIIS